MGKFSVLWGHAVSAVEAGFSVWKGFFPPSNVKTRNLKPTPLHLSPQKEAFGVTWRKL